MSGIRDLNKPPLIEGDLVRLAIPIGRGRHIWEGMQNDVGIIVDIRPHGGRLNPIVGEIAMVQWSNGEVTSFSLGLLERVSDG